MGPLLSQELGQGPWLGGQDFTAMDIVLGYPMEVNLPISPCHVFSSVCFQQEGLVGGGTAQP